MSLAGNLSELGLIELLQMIGLSRKSGVLEIHGGVDSAWLGIQGGAIARVARMDRDLDRERLLEGAGVAPESPAAREILARAASDAVLELLGWKEGRFWFRATPDPVATWDAPEGLLLDPAVPPEYLALERARRDDEGWAGEEDPLQGTRPPLESEIRAREIEEPAPAKPEPQAMRLPGVLIALDPDLELLECIKREFQGAGLRVHIFQDAADGLARLKDYLVRGEFPAVVLGSGLASPAWSRAGSGWQEIAERVRRMAPLTSVVLLAGPERPQRTDCVDAVVRRPDQASARSHEMRELMERLGTALARDTRAPRRA